MCSLSFYLSLIMIMFSVYVLYNFYMVTGLWKNMFLVHMLLNFYFDMFLLSLMVLVLVFMSVKCFLGFGKSFTNMFILLLFMVLFNFLCLFNKSMLLFLTLLVFLSFYSMFLILYGYGTGMKVVMVVLFKGFSDVLMLLLVSNIMFLQLDCKLDSFMFFGLDLGIILLLMFFVYSLFGVFGFWLFWAMEASYFMSCFMHSCGFMSVGLMFFIKLSMLGVLKDLTIFMNFVNMVSLMSYLFFLLMFFVVKDCKKSFGFYSASSMCFLLFTSVNFPYMSISYFFMSSVIKVLMFEMLSFLNKSNNVKWFMFSLFIFNIFTYSLFFMMGSFNNSFMEIIYFMFLIKLISLIMFVFKVFNMLDFDVFGFNFNFIMFLMFGLVFNKFSYSMVFNSWMGSSMGYIFLLTLLIKFNFYSFSSFKSMWFKVYNMFLELVTFLMTLMMFYINIFSISPTDLFKLINSKYNVLNNNQLIFYVIFMPVFMVLIF